MGYGVRAQEIANFLKEELFGENIIVNVVKPLNGLVSNSFTFSKSKDINIDKKVLVLLPKNVIFENVSFSYICVDNPRLAFAKVVNQFFIKKVEEDIDLTTKIGKNCCIEKNVSIGSNCVIGDNVRIRKGTIINNHVVIYDNTTIGENCYIKSGTIIGEDGFGFDFEEDRTPIRIPHMGNVVIGNNVEIGAKNTIARATLDKTIIEDNVKIDDQVHIAHNCKIGKNTIITACVEISGSVTIGQNCWIGPNCSIIQKVKIGNSVVIGIGSVITIDIEDNKKIMGLEGLDLRNLLKVKKRIGYGK
ncbi:UDP-3-O-(3-hydroxymyristoyl)glucosamine N-acyltransferase [Aliarcobacter vitoriensis]|uniref:UDP-3-O-(3-hydroxymyristoyl)glucosamine N-acyltransferase n=1 Tax=Aliarcobacter vitoriensis TaxID=2011099 RepID=A0A366MUT1_9BACT|nr:UDP-3-O-(3-hydroxymyristoyl)glucosamine N-acyltransferase [Aliarcobacter vitoriensis]RBQ29239.1 UDP-3-O-(3-hydroxymyristoyl)glucosamine N-acyltransferase [Aliarcobacter vitoriensis]